MEQKAIEIANAHRIMAVSTVRPDGWPQNTIVGYANEGLLVYFLISRSSQKFANIQADDRISVAIGSEPDDFSQLKALYAGAHASEVTDPKQREHAWNLLIARHPNLADYEVPDWSAAAMMRAPCMFVSIVDFTKGLGHADNVTVSGPGLALMEPARVEDWGYGPALGTSPDSGRPAESPSSPRRRRETPALAKERIDEKLQSDRAGTA